MAMVTPAVGIGVVLSSRSEYGGSHQYALTMAAALSDPAVAPGQATIYCDEHAEIDPGALAARRAAPVVIPRSLCAHGRVARLLGDGVLRRLWGGMRSSARRAARYGCAASRGRGTGQSPVRSLPALTRWFHDRGIELVLYTMPDCRAFEVRIPSVMPIHDLQHRLQPWFPEVSADGEWDRREYLYANAARHAALVLADSEVGKQDILDCYGGCGITEERVRVLPFLASPRLPPECGADEVRRVRTKHGLPERYLFYPAHFWPHKNHRRIIEALKLLDRPHGELPHAVFCGTRRGPLREQTHREVMETAERLGMRARVHVLGYVSEAELAALYRGAGALVMPTFFGPTNIPVLEAWQLGCPVVTSDIRGIREQVGNAALLADPGSVESIAACVHRVWTDEALRRDLIARGRAQLARYTPADYRRRLADILREAHQRATAVVRGDAASIVPV
jgi:glycosyltransferase involved in cell wall biosynthesis